MQTINTLYKTEYGISFTLKIEITKSLGVNLKTVNIFFLKILNSIKKRIKKRNIRVFLGRSYNVDMR